MTDDKKQTDDDTWIAERLDLLNREPLVWLIQELHRAVAMRQDNPFDRNASITALNAIIHGLPQLLKSDITHTSTELLELVKPLTDLRDALHDLNKGARPDLLAPPTVPGKPKRAERDANIAAAAVMFYEIFVNEGVNLDQAQDRAAREMNRLGYTSRGSPFTPRIIQRLREKVSEQELTPFVSKTVEAQAISTAKEITRTNADAKMTIETVHQFLALRAPKTP
jgi:hypothetical protein